MATSSTPAPSPLDSAPGVRFVATPGPVIGSLCTGLGGLDLGVASVLGGRIAWTVIPGLIPVRTPERPRHDFRRC